VTARDWEAFHRRWSNLKPPLRASPDVVETLRLTFFDGSIPPGRGGKFEEFMCLIE
jgi:hypothetical protein